MNFAQFLHFFGPIFGIAFGGATTTTALVRSTGYVSRSTPLIIDTARLAEIHSTEHPNSVSQKFLSSLSTESPYEKTTDGPREKNTDKIVIFTGSWPTEEVKSSKDAGSTATGTGSTGPEATTGSSESTTDSSDDTTSESEGPMVNATTSEPEVTTDNSTSESEGPTGNSTTSEPESTTDTFNVTTSEAGNTTESEGPTGNGTTGESGGTTDTFNVTTSEAGNTTESEGPTGNGTTGESGGTTGTFNGTTSEAGNSTGSESTATGTDVTPTGTDTPTTTAKSTEKHKLSKGAVAGIVIGCLLLVAIVTAAIVFVVKQRNSPEAQRLNV